MKRYLKGIGLLALCGAFFSLLIFGAVIEAPLWNAALAADQAAVTELEKLQAENLALKVANAEQEISLLQQRYQAISQQLQQLRQQAQAHEAAVLEAHKSAKGSRVDWAKGVIVGPVAKAAEKKP